jgi:ferrous iron transport protein B
MSIQELFTEAQSLSTSKLRDEIVQQLYDRSRQLCHEGISYTKSKQDTRTEKLDSIFTSPIFGFPIMITMLGVLFYLTIAGACFESSGRIPLLLQLNQEIQLKEN